MPAGGLWFVTGKTTPTGCARRNGHGVSIGSWNLRCQPPATGTFIVLSRCQGFRTVDRLGLAAWELYGHRPHIAIPGRTVAL